MKKKLLLLMFLFIPFIKVNALECYDGLIDVTKVDNFVCKKVQDSKLTFFSGDVDYSKYFTYNIEDNKAVINIDKSITFDSKYEEGYVTISDGKSENGTIKVKNKDYVTTTTTTTTTTTESNSKEVVVTLVPNNNSDKTSLSCKIKSGSTYCNVTLPKLEDIGFNGWGTASTCKEGSVGSIKVEKNITYYACYTTNNNEESDKNLALKSLKLTNKDTNEEIKFGTFSIKKTEYSLKVLNEVKSINVDAKSEDGVEVTVSGNEDLIEGENEIIIKLTSNNKTNQYIIKVTRLKEGEKINSIHYLKSLVVGGYNIDFDKDKFNYTITIDDNIDKLEIDPVLEDESNKYEVVDNNNLKNGSIIKINVTGEDDVTTTYSINIIKEEKINILFYVAIGLIVILVIILIILIIIKSNRKKKNNISQPKTYENKDNIEVLNI